MEQDQLEQAIAAQERLRGVVPDDVVDAAIATMRQRRAEIEETPTMRRRQATVLFADLVGFTALSESMDAEVVTGIVNDLWQRLDAVVLRHGGHIDKHIGDALMAVWGMELTRESDPESAVRGALELQETVGAFAAQTGRGLSMRVGVNTGPVVLGEVGTTGERTAMGDTVNVASRLEGSAPMGGVLISHETYRHVRGVFDVAQLDPIRLRGRTEPMRTYAVLEAKPRAFRMPTRGVEGVETRTIGREDEMGELRGAFAQVLAEGGSHLVTVIGEAGVGKSRLLDEFDDWVELHAEFVYYFKGRAVPQRQGVPYGLLRDLVAERCEILDSDPSAVALAKLRAATAVTLSADEAAQLGRWLGFDLGDLPEVARLVSGANVGRSHLVRYLTTLAADSPLVWLLEDAHWADDESLDVIDGLVTTMAGRPLLVVAVARPELLDRRPDWSVGPSRDRLTLGPLTVAQTRALVDEILQRAMFVPDELRELVVTRSEGQPFFVEELVKVLIDDGVIDPGKRGGTWSISLDRLGTTRIPSTLTGVLQARLDALPADDLAALQHAAVVGRVFWDSAIAALASEQPTDGAPTATAVLDTAVERELVFPREPSAFSGTYEYAFKHALLRDVAYETVLLGDRPTLHERAAHWLEDASGERRGEYLAVIATHHREAGAPAAAAACLDEAARSLLRAGDPRAARRSADEAVGLWARAGTEPAPSALLVLGDACYQLGDTDAADRHVQAAVALARHEGDGATLVRAGCLAARIAERRGEWATMATVLADIRPTAEALGGEAMVELLVELAWSSYHRGDVASSTEQALRGLAIVEHDELDAPAEIKVRQVLAVFCAEQGDTDAGLRHGDLALARCRETGDLVAQAGIHGSIGAMHHLAGDRTGERDRYLAARSHYEQSVAIARRIEALPRLASSLGNLAQVLVRLDDPQAAFPLCREALEIHRTAGADPAMLYLVLFDAEALIATGSHRTGLAHIGVVMHQPILGDAEHTEIERILGRLRTELDADDLDAGLAAGAGLDLEAVIAGILARPPVSLPCLDGQPDG